MKPNCPLSERANIELKSQRKSIHTCGLQKVVGHTIYMTNMPNGNSEYLFLILVDPQLSSQQINTPKQLTYYWKVAKSTRQCPHTLKHTDTSLICREHLIDIPRWCQLSP